MTSHNTGHGDSAGHGCGTSHGYSSGDGTGCGDSISCAYGDGTGCGDSISYGRAYGGDTATGIAPSWHPTRFDGTGGIP